MNMPRGNIRKTAGLLLLYPPRQGPLLYQRRQGLRPHQNLRAFFLLLTLLLEDGLPTAARMAGQTARFEPGWRRISDMNTRAHGWGGWYSVP